MKHKIALITIISFLFACNNSNDKTAQPEKNLLINHTKPNIKSEACIQVFDSATAYADIGDFATAQELLFKCNKMEPGNGTILNTIGSSYFALKDTATALKYFFAAIRADSLRPEAYAGAGCALEMQGKYADALNILKTGFAKTNSDQFTYYNISLNLAVTYFSMDSCLKAKEYIAIAKNNGFNNSQFDGRVQKIESNILNYCK
jgi:tetratricopeptide (TPR) repeat protein